MSSLVIKYSRRWRSIYQYSAIAFFVIAITSGIHLILTDSTLMAPQGVVLLLFAITAFILLSLGRVPMLTIEDSGLKIGWFTSTIPWERIESVSIRSLVFQQFLMVKFVEASRFRREKLFYLLWKLIFLWFHSGYDFSINISSLELGSDEILSTIKGRISERKAANA